MHIQKQGYTTKKSTKSLGYTDWLPSSVLKDWKAKVYSSGCEEGETTGGGKPVLYIYCIRL